MYRKVVLPLDGSAESEGVFALIREELASDGTLIPLHVIRPPKTIVIGGQIVDASALMEVERSKAMGYLRDAGRRMGVEGVGMRCEVVVADSVSEGIVEFAVEEEADLIAMYTHDRKGLARLIKGSIARNVQRKVPMAVEVFTPREVAAVGA